VVTPVGAWQAIAATVVGPSHRRAGRGGEDAVGSHAADGVQAIAVADGHGSPRCYRAARGAELAVAAALEVLGQQPWDDGPPAVARQAAGIGAALVNAWRGRVTADLASRPLGSLPDDVEPLDGSTYTPYGTTVVAAAASREALLIVHLGDGASLVVSSPGGPRRPVPRDPAIAADATTSLALDDAEDYVHVVATDLRDDPTELVVLASDGYSNAFTDDAAFDQVGTDLLRWLGGPDPAIVARDLPSWLDQSAQVTGDDASLALLYRPIPIAAR
jgi:serine/threonine protein phosphatase PrpC